MNPGPCNPGRDFQGPRPARRGDPPHPRVPQGSPDTRGSTSRRVGPVPSGAAPPARTGIHPGGSCTSPTTGRFPARTGIDRWTFFDPRFSPGFPRAHGDRPAAAGRPLRTRECPARTGIDRLDTTLARSPHARGSARRAPTESGRRGTTSPTMTAVFADRPSATGERSATTGVDEEREPSRREERDAEKSQDQQRVARRRPRQE